MLHLLPSSFTPLRLALAFAALLCLVALLRFLFHLIGGANSAFSAQAALFLEENPGALQTGASLQFAAAPAPGSPEATLFLVHGSPGDWQAFAAYLRDPDLTSRFLVVAPDRPGYGGSDPRSPSPSLPIQATQLAALAQDFPPPHLWAGHSFGATVIAQLAVDFPHLVDGLLLIGGAMSPELEPVRWYHRFADLPPARRLLPSAWHSANQEAISFASDLLDLQPRWKEINCPVVLLHATDDRLADFRNVEFTTARMPHNPPTVIALPDGDHFLPWNRYAETKAALLHLASKVVDAP